MRLPDRDRSRAVLIGVGRYADADLPDVPAVHNNVRDLRRELTRTGGGAFHPEHCVEINDPVDGHSLGRQLLHAARAAEDVFLVYFAGHGLVGRRRRELYLALGETDPDALFYTAMSFEGVREAFLTSPAKSRILLLDCCFSGRAIGEQLSDEVSAMVGQIEISGTYILTSAAANEPALVAPGATHTAFTGELITLLRNGIPREPDGLTLDALYRELHRSLTARGLPAPQRCGTETAQELVLAANRSQPAAVPPPGPDPDPEPVPQVPDPAAPAVGEEPAAPAQQFTELSAEAGQLRKEGDLEGAVTAYRTLTQQDLMEHGVAFVDALHDWSVTLTEADRHEEARAASAEGVATCRAMARQDPIRRLELGWALVDLSYDKRELGRKEGARADLEEAVRLFRAPDERDAPRHGDYRDGLADALGELGSLLMDLGRHAKAAPVYEEAAGLLRDAVQDGKAERSELAGLLDRLAHTLGELDQPVRALAVAEEAVALYRELAADEPQLHSAPLARALLATSSLLSKMDGYEKSYAAADAAVDIFRVLAEEDPDGYSAELADALLDVGADLTHLARHKEAHQADVEAVSLLRTLVEKDSATHRPKLATALKNLSIDLQNLHRRNEAQEVVKEAAALQATEPAPGP
ncbi:caspase family protein [Streptomyces sp. NPDC018031]|uniref:caspase, EACC1-associated type n=1 Tax=Streptomyces sp. NPDC018031 TaxID=3365033 RepID=UPI0037BBE720